MQISLERLEDKIEFFEAGDLHTLEKKISEQIDNNKALLLHVQSVQYQTQIHPETGHPIYSACIHFKAK